MNDQYPRQSQPSAGENQFHASLLDSLRDINELLVHHGSPQLHQDITAFLAEVDGNSGATEDLLPAIRYKLYALLALSR
ncbi:MAG TPA: hypothetical protein P5549_06410 [Syntrophomonas sp.]|nr:hypothetical protein [Syntrophomonas sp.]